MEEVSEEVGSFAFQDCESDIYKILHSNNNVRFVYIYFSSVFVVGTKTSKASLVYMVNAEHNFITEDLQLPHKPQAFCFGQDAA